MIGRLRPIKRPIGGSVSAYQQTCCHKGTEPMDDRNDFSQSELRKLDVTLSKQAGRLLTVLS